MNRRALLFFVVLCGGLLMTTGTVLADTTSTPEPIHECAPTPPEDFEPPDDGIETIGWVDGYWYNEPLDIETDSDLSEAELEAVTARTAARMEAMRCLTFEETPPVEIITREQFEADTESQFEGVTDDERLFENAKLETVSLVGSEEDALDVRQAVQGASVAGYYDFEREEIVIVADEALSINEPILAHELGHALQDQAFNLGQYDRNTTDRNAGKLGVIEGDIHRLENQYQEACEQGSWVEDCLEQAGGGGGQPPNQGLFLLEFQPYSDGPAFVDGVYEDGGWDAVDDLYAEIPQSALYTIQPDTYGRTDLVDSAVEDQSNDEFDRLLADESRGQAHDVIGPAGLAATLMATANEDGVLEQEDILNDANTASRFNYDHAETDGWRGDRLYAYHDGENGTGTVWQLAWRDSEAAAGFAEAYRELIAHHGGEPVSEYENAYRFGADSDFEKALAIRQEGDRLLIVTAPTVGELTAVHSTLALEEAESGIGNENGTATDEEQADEIPGFGIGIGVAGIAVGVVLMLTIMRSLRVNPPKNSMRNPNARPNTGHHHTQRIVNRQLTVADE